MATTRVRNFRHELDVQTRTGSTTPGTRGQTSKTMHTVETVQGQVIPLVGRQLQQAREIVATATHRVETFYTTTITPTSRFKFGSRYLNIEYVRNVDERNRYLEAICTEEVV